MYKKLLLSTRSTNYRVVTFRLETSWEINHYTICKLSYEKTVSSVGDICRFRSPGPNDHFRVQVGVGIIYAASSSFVLVSWKKLQVACGSRQIWMHFSSKPST